MQEGVLAKMVGTVEEKMETVMVESGEADMVEVRKVEEQLRTRNQNNNTYNQNRIPHMMDQLGVGVGINKF